MDRVTRHLERRAAGEQPDPDLPFSVDKRNKGHHLPVGGDRGRLLQTDEVSQSPELHVALHWTRGCGRLPFRGAPGQSLVDIQRRGIADVAPPAREGPSARQRRRSRVIAAGVRLGQIVDQSGSRLEDGRNRVAESLPRETPGLRRAFRKDTAERPDVRAPVGGLPRAPARGSCTWRYRPSRPRASGRPSSAIVTDRHRTRVRFGEPEVQDLHTPSGVTLTFAGLRSRCTMPFSWAASSASAICRAIGSASSRVERSARQTALRASSPSTNSRMRPTVLSHLLDAIDCRDMGMVQRRQHLRLSLEARGAVRDPLRGKLGKTLIATSPP